MKKRIFKLGLLLSMAVMPFVACSDDDVDKNHSIFETSSEVKSPFDEWLYNNYVQAYNIDYKYRMDDKDIDYSYNLAPSDLKKSMQLAVIIKHAWLEAYTEVAGVDFIRKHAPAILPVIGSAAWNNDGTYTLGTAEGGLKITLYMGNWLDPKDINRMNEYFFKTMHHEFTHILQQDVYYPNMEYDKISASDYRPSGWHNRRYPEYAKLGFITSYAGSSAVEDITEVTASYITMTDQEWQHVFDGAGEEGRAKLNQKVKIMKGYMKDVWHIDMDQLRQVVHRRMAEVTRLELLKPEWLPMIQKEESAATSRAAFDLLKSELKRQWPEASKKIDRTPNCCHVHDAELLNIINH